MVMPHAVVHIPRGKAHRYVENPNIDIVRGVCPHDCPDACAWQVAVTRDDRRAVDLWGDAGHPFTAGSLCEKVDRYLERTYHRDRLTSPMKRVGRKGEGKFFPISWEEAVGETADALGKVIRKWGPEAVLPYSYGGTLGYLQGEGMASRFFTRLGASRLARTICAEAGVAGYRYSIGAMVGMDPLDLPLARTILIGSVRNFVYGRTS
ncbi:MAG: molybdopterin-dependent oxidoreductase [Nannocystaceae bacterium]